MTDKGAPHGQPQQPKREPPDKKGEKPYIPRSLRETGGSDADKAGEQEPRVDIANAGRREHNL